MWRTRGTQKQGFEVGDFFGGTAMAFSFERGSQNPKGQGLAGARGLVPLAFVQLKTAGAEWPPLLTGRCDRERYRMAETLKGARCAKRIGPGPPTSWAGSPRNC